MENLLKLIPIYSILLLFASFLSLAFYYSYFGIEIYNYIDISELFVLSLPMFKNMFIAIFILLSFPFVAFSIGFVNHIFTSPNKQIKERVIKELASDGTKKTKEELSIDQLVNKLVAEQVGFHLTTEIAEFLDKEHRQKQTKARNILQITTIVLASCFFVYLVFTILQCFIQYLNYVRFQSPEFYTKPGKIIAMLVLNPIFMMLVLSYFFGGKLQWSLWYSHLFKQHIIPFLFLGIFLVSSLLYRYADYLTIKNGKSIDQYTVFINGEKTGTETKGYRFIGRTKNFLFLVKGNIVKSINVSEADSIVFNKNNRIR